jgi:hypothetical protein
MIQRDFSRSICSNENLKGINLGIVNSHYLPSKSSCKDAKLSEEVADFGDDTALMVRFEVTLMVKVGLRVWRSGRVDNENLG